MKDKKRVLKVLAVLIIAIMAVLGIVLIFGSIKDKQVKDFYAEVEGNACKYAKDENLTKELCEAFNNLCKIRISTLINNEYIEESLQNPINKRNLKNDVNSYVQISWKNGKMICEYKEG